MGQGNSTPGEPTAAASSSPSPQHYQPASTPPNTPALHHPPPPTGSGAPQQASSPPAAAPAAASGAAPSAASLTRAEDIEILLRETHFSREELAQLVAKFAEISNSISPDDGVIDKEEFRMALGINKSLAIRIFSIFDSDCDGGITFQEFVRVLDLLSPNGSFDDKVKLSFKLYDRDGDGHICKEELFQMLEVALQDNRMLSLTADDMRELVDSTFAEVDKDEDGMISYEEYYKTVKANPAIIDFLTITVQPDDEE